MTDDLAALLDSRKWVKRRVDRVEFLDLMTVRRTIILTLDLGQLACARSRRCARPPGDHLVPLGWFAPWANAGAVLVGADQRVIPYLTSRESDSKITQQIGQRLDALGLARLKPRLDAVLEHRRDPGLPGCRCQSCEDAVNHDGHRQLMTDKWGCRAVLSLLDDLHGHPASGERGVEELARILLAWQRNFVLFACLDASSSQTGRVTLQLSYDEELLEWEPPWEHRRRVLEPEALRCQHPAECRAYVSRGGPFSQDLDELAPTGLGGALARSRPRWLRKLGRRGPLHVAWHVAWHQASGLDVAEHHVDVVLPNELAAVRMRMLRMIEGDRRATVADQVGSHATIVAPEFEQSGHGRRDGHWSPTLFSLVITQCSPASWYGGAWIASFTGVALILVAALWLPEVVRDADAGVASLMLAPTLVSTVLSVRAASEIAGQLATVLRRLIGAVGVIAATCALALIVHPGPPEPTASEQARGIAPPIEHLWALRSVWIGAGVALIAIAAALLLGARRTKRLLRYGRRSAPRYITDVTPGKVLNPDDPDAPWIGPPDCWLDADEGDLVPWGWLNGVSSRGSTTGSDAQFWSGLRSPRGELVRWVHRIVGYREPPASPLPCPQCWCESQPPRPRRGRR